MGKKKEQISRSQIVWFGGDILVVRYYLVDGSKRMVDMNGTEGPDLSTDKYPAPNSINENERRVWASIKKIGFGAPGQSNPSDGVTDVDPATWETNYQSISTNYINTNVNQKQWYYTTINGVPEATGCSPTAGSNIMKYWADQGVAKNLNPTGNQQNIVMALRSTMGTTQDSNGTGVTQPTSISGGLEQYAQNQGYSNAYSTSIYAASFSDYTVQVDAGRPALQSYWSQYYFGDHTVTVVGYKHFIRAWYQSDSYYIVVRNNFINDSTFNLYVKWGTWNANQLTKFWFVY